MHIMAKITLVVLGLHSEVFINWTLQYSWYVTRFLTWRDPTSPAGNFLYNLSVKEEVWNVIIILGVVSIVRVLVYIYMYIHVAIGKSNHQAVWAPLYDPLGTWLQLLPRDINSVSNGVFLALSGIPARNSENLSQMCICSILYWYRHFEIFRKRLSRGRRESLPFVGDLLQTRRRSALIVGKWWGPSLHCQIPISSFIPNHVILGTISPASATAKTLVCCACVPVILDFSIYFLLTNHGNN